MFERQWRMFLFPSGLYSVCGKYSATQDICGPMLQSRHNAKGWVRGSHIWWHHRASIVAVKGNSNQGSQKHIIEHNPSVASSRIFQWREWLLSLPCSCFSASVSFHPCRDTDYLCLGHINSNVHKNRSHVSYSGCYPHFPYRYVRVQRGGVKWASILSFLCLCLHSGA